MKENIKSMQPKNVVDESFKEAGGILHIKSAREVCRARLYSSI